MRNEALTKVKFNTITALFLILTACGKSPEER